MDALAGRRFVLGPWSVDPALGQIERQDQLRRIEPRTMRLLSTLAAAQGEMVSTDALMDAVWSDVVVTPSSLYEAVAQLRRALGNDDGGQDFIVTVPRRGYRLRAPVMTIETTVPRPRSIAVRPFRTRALPASHAFLPEILTDDLIGELSRQPDLFVMARGTMLRLADSDMPSIELGRQLGVRFVIEGSIEAQGGEWQVTANVVDVEQGRQAWADSIVIALEAWPGVGVAVVGRLARALDFELRDATARPRSTRDGRALDARALATRAWVELFARPESRLSNAQAMQLAEQSRGADPDLPLAAVCLATADWRAAQFGWSTLDRSKLLARALIQAERAVDLGARDPDAHYVLALIAYSRGETVRAEEALRHCIRLSASFAPAYGLLALIRTRRGFASESQALCERAFALSPREPLRAVWHLANAWAGLASGDFEGALEASQRGMSVNPDFATCYLTGAAAAQRCGVHELAQAWVSHLRERTVFCSLKAIRDWLPPATEPAHKQQMDNVVEWLRAAGLPST